MPEETLRVVYEPLHEINRWPKNPKDHDIQVITRSFHRHGFVAPLIKDEGTGRLVAGHGRLDALLQAHHRGDAPPRRVQRRDDGEWLVPVLRGIAFPTEEHAVAYLVADNQSTIAGGWNDNDLAEVLQLLAGDREGLDGTGFDRDDLDDLLERLGDRTMSRPTQAASSSSSSSKVTCPSCGHQFEARGAR